MLFRSVDPDGSVARVDFFDDANRIGRATNAPYQAFWTASRLGAHQLRAAAIDNKGAVGTSAPVSVTVTLPVSSLVNYVSTGSVWKYLDNGSDQGTAWRETAFDDSSWAEGPAELGFGDAADGRPEATMLNPGTNAQARFVTYYFRKQFTAPDAI